MRVFLLTLSIFFSGCVLEYSLGEDEQSDTDESKDKDTENPADSNTEIVDDTVSETDEDTDTVSSEDTQEETDDTGNDIESDTGSEIDNDSDSSVDQCPNDPSKTEPGLCGCGISDVDSDGDTIPDCNDQCPEDPKKREPGECGCGFREEACIPFCAEGNGVLDVKTGLCWLEKKTGERALWFDAMEYCESLTLGGVDNWRLPTRGELANILGGCDENVKAGGNGYCNTCAASQRCSELFPGDIKDYWSSTVYTSDDRVWIVRFETGTVRLNDDTKTNRARCVTP